MVQVAKFIWMDGKFVRWKDAKVHISTHALHYGSAAFEGIRCYEANDKITIFRLNDHINRLFYSANALGMKIGFTKIQIKEAIIKTIRLNKMKNAYIRPISYYGQGSIRVYPKKVPVNLSIIIFPDYDRDNDGLKVMTSKFLRYPEKSAIFGAKISGNYVNSIMAMQEARKKGYDEALMLDIDGFVSEGPAENLFLIKNGSLLTPNSRSALHGITRDTIMRLAKDIDINVYEEKISLAELYDADELFLCGTGKEISSIFSVEGKKIGNGKIGEITLKLKKMYFDAVTGKDKKYMKWLTFVEEQEL